ncbi:MAG: hypothetical protein EB060_01685 [Proteobacteria bacterium]|nr:hypothetical protein [Pseudomonadota bacterium]
MSQSSKRRKKHQEVEEGWLLTYADMITLLLCVFLIMLSVSQPELKKLKEVEKQLRQQFGTQDEIKLITNTDNNPPAEKASPFFSIMEHFTGVMKENVMLSQDVFTRETKNGGEIVIRSAPMFKPGEAKLTAEGEWTVDQLASTLSAFGYAKYVISVEGHTDNIPITSAMFPSNWYLSAARAAAVVERLIVQGIDATKLRAVGYGDTRPEVPNQDLDGHPIEENQAINRRVTIRIENAN